MSEVVLFWFLTKPNAKRREAIRSETPIEKLDSIYGSFNKASEKKKGYVLPRAKMVNVNLLVFFFNFF